MNRENVANTAILLIDDNVQNLMVLASVLSAEFTTDLVLAQSGPEALTAMANQEIDLVLLDINMPGMNGYEVCTHLKADPRSADVPIIFLTSQQDVNSIVRGFDVGGADYLGKPFDNRELVVRVRTQLELRKTRLEAIRLMSELTLANEKLEYLSITDGLMEIANRRHFNEVLQREWTRAMRSSETLGLIILDIDHFKLYNDHYGHVAGDDCLRRVATAVKSCVRRSSDLLARYGGEELVLLLPDTNPGTALVLAEKVRLSVVAANIPHEKSSAAPHVTVSLGVCAVVPNIGASSDSLIRMADDALYRAKDNGRNRVESHLD